ncbi:hypothetical protein GPECTOR_18g117 [Gonium pectorale]|uniref:Uncharacterized protein n=1 Tax=Gonium pectorale TaxID=33097 RepID=A0A150GJH0_GONPE|nr:hypothetical protein GPECTOR_18g117 [Gonium pectorale]|eukprot:KXZ49959.1 hypothetical protein GPECTOR_18g117 [Gonium pectorale]
MHAAAKPRLDPPPSTPSPLLALTCIDYESQQRFLEGLSQRTLAALRAVCRPLRAFAEPLLERAELRFQVRDSRPSDLLPRLDRFFASVAARPLCEEVVVQLGLPAGDVAASHLALAFESGAEAGRLPQVTRLALQITCDDAEPVIGSTSRPRFAPLPPAVGFARSLCRLFPSVERLEVSGSWAAAYMSQLEGADRMYAIWSGSDQANANKNKDYWRPQSWPGRLARLRHLTIELLLHERQSGVLPQVSDLVLLQPPHDKPPPPQLEQGITGLVSRVVDVFQGSLESLTLRGGGGRHEVRAQGRPPALPAALAAVRYKAWLLRRVRLEDCLADSDPDHEYQHDSMHLDSAEVVWDPLAAGEGAMDYRIEAKFMGHRDLLHCATAAQQGIVLDPDEQPNAEGPPLALGAPRTVRVMVDVLEGPGSSFADAASSLTSWQALVVLSPPGLTVRVQREAHVGLGSLAHFMDAVNRGVVSLGPVAWEEGPKGERGRGAAELVVHWHGWRGATAVDADLASALLPKVGGDPQATVNELAEWLLELAPERRPAALRLEMGGGGGAGAEAEAAEGAAVPTEQAAGRGGASAAVASLQSALQGLCPVVVE